MLRHETFRPIIRQTIAEERLPPEFAAIAETYFIPLCDYIVERHQRLKRPLIAGINGAQGTGKSTLALLLKRLLQAQQLQCVTLSIDDLYLTREERTRLADTVHPLMQTRGVPGTHDLSMGLGLVAELTSAQFDSRIAIPRFDKARDDRSPEQSWTVHKGSVDIILIEGWCVGARPISLAGKPINTLEQQHDAEGVWRAYVETQLLDYQRLFTQLDILLMLKAPSMECIIEWRTLQEQKLREGFGATTQADGSPHTPSAPNEGTMNASELQWFIMHYERLTQAMLEQMPAYADVVCELNEKHCIIAAHYREHSGGIS